MKLSMKWLLPLAAGILAQPVVAQVTAMVVSVKERTDALALAEELLAEPSIQRIDSLTASRDPFEVMVAEAVATGSPVEVQVAGPRYNDRQILEAIAPRVEPTGSVRIGDTDYLLFGQKRLKVGEKLTITYEGSVHAVEISSIERNNFRIRLNSEELVRPIK